LTTSIESSVQSTLPALADRRLCLDLRAPFPCKRRRRSARRSRPGGYSEPSGAAIVDAVLSFGVALGDVDTPAAPALADSNFDLERTRRIGADASQNLANDFVDSFGRSSRSRVCATLI
jgi:hypothetical protein